MIPTHEVIDAVLASLRADWPVGDGAPPVSPAANAPYSWLARQPAPGGGPRFGGGEPALSIRVRVSTAIAAGDKGLMDGFRSAAQRRADALRAVMLGADMWAGATWRVSGRQHEATADVDEPGALTIHEDFLLFVARVAT